MSGGSIDDLFAPSTQSPLSPPKSPLSDLLFQSILADDKIEESRNNAISPHISLAYLCTWS
jgi:hypothetical protein